MRHLQWSIGSWTAAMQVVLISTYELGHQPFGLASPAAWLRARGAAVTCLDLSREPISAKSYPRADSGRVLRPNAHGHATRRSACRARARLNPRAHLCFYGLYAPVNEGPFSRAWAWRRFWAGFEEGARTAAVTRLEEAVDSRTSHTLPFEPARAGDLARPAQLHGP